MVSSRLRVSSACVLSSPRYQSSASPAHRRKGMSATATAKSETKTRRRTSMFLLRARDTCASQAGHVTMQLGGVMDPIARDQAKGFLHQVPIFGGLPETALQRLLELMRLRVCAPGQVICAEGDPAREMF